MDSSKPKRPSLSRLETDISPPPRPATTSLPLAPVALQGPNLRRVETAPGLFTDITKEENVAPAVRHAPDAKSFSVTEKTVEEAPVAKKKTQYYEEVFGHRGSHNSPSERVHQDSVVVAELKMNRKVKDEQSKLAEDFLFRLSQVYQRPENCIMVTVHQESCVLFGSNNTLPYYLLTVYALPSFIAPVTNIRNTTLIQRALEELLGIPPSLGVIIYIPIPEENLATNSTTVRGEISQMERSEQGDSPNLFKSISRSMSRRLKTGSGQSVPFSLPSVAATASPSTRTPSEAPASPRDKELGDVNKMSIRKRIFKLLGDRMTMEANEKEAREAKEKAAQEKEAQEKESQETKQTKEEITETENVDQ